MEKERDEISFLFLWNKVNHQDRNENGKIIND